MKPIFSNRLTYIAWALISSLLLLIGYFVDPYVFGFLALGAGWVSGVIILSSLLFAWKMVLWALIGALPTIASILFASTFNWA